jgi:hypothetical protein
MTGLKRRADDPARRGNLLSVYSLGKGYVYGKDQIGD